MELQGNTVLVTGGASGIGRSIVQELLARDNTVIVCGRDPRKLEALRQEQPRVKTIVADLSTTAEVERLAGRVLKEFPALNGVIHSAAVQHNNLMTDDDYEPQRIDEEVRINLVAPMLLTKLLLPALRRRDTAFLVNITSGLAMVPKTRSAVYCGTKGGLRIFSQSLRHQLRGTPVRVIELLPPVVDTPMTHGRAEELKISPEQVARELMRGLARDKEEIRVGKVKLLAWLQRLAPGTASRMMSRLALIPLLLTISP
ncbi:SDR family oxidoreductase [Archangium lansingense]|uniref:SDR family NAD(P)-dependent oxidoreductase n=1 Tax=Archangium lansingense TaxID=2995310 RepID=A0ABT4AC77_9BACT|nr:SDR family NAD(P)-dependent oxidoreductase [Archangium lansinium]MCY1079278.1 SDR family NAD(P)-dependent oxidoreductase [Archangium lansinium]